MSLHDVFVAASNAKTPREAAAIYAQAGIKIFPADPVTKAPMRGVRWNVEATSNVQTVALMWSQHPEAAIGLPLGEASGLCVVDIDVPTEKKLNKTNGFETIKIWADAGYRLADTLTISTPSGGQHHFYLGTLKGQAHGSVDLKGNGGYIIAPGSKNDRGKRWQVLHNHPIVAAPNFLASPLKNLTSNILHGCDALSQQIQRIEGACEGERNNTLNSAAYAVGKLVKSGAVLHGVAEAQLIEAAMKTGLPFEEAKNTAQSGLNAGQNVHPSGQQSSSRHSSGMLSAVVFDPDVSIPPAHWLVDGVFPETGLGVIYGEPGAGKSFLCADLSVGVAHGGHWFGYTAEKGSVVYVAAEGGERFQTRLKAAWRSPQWHGKRMADALVSDAQPEPQGQITVVIEAPDLMNESQLLIARIEDAASRAPEHAPLRLVVIDTLAESIPGADENSAGDMSKALRPLREAAQRLSLFILIIHHPGKAAGAGPRGSGALKGAVDTLIELTVPGREGDQSKAGALRRATTIKIRDAAEGREFFYRLPAVNTGNYKRNGEPETTCVVEVVWNASEDTAKVKRYPRVAQKILEIIRSKADPDGRANYAIVRELFTETQSGKETGTINVAWSRALAALSDDIEVARDENAIRLKGKSE